MNKNYAVLVILSMTFSVSACVGFRTCNNCKKDAKKSEENAEVRTVKNVIMISITDIAKEKLVELRQTEGHADDAKLRVSVKGGGCSGLMYDLGFDDNVSDSDQVLEDKGFTILVDKKSVLYLAGTTLDFSDGLNGKGFQFVNPNASRTCGCGESFAV